MITVFFDIKGIIHIEYSRERITADSYIETLMNLHDSIRQKHPKMWLEHNWILLDDNAPVHTTDDTVTFRRQVKRSEADNTPNSPDLAPSDFFLFPKMKSQLRGRHFKDLQELKDAVIHALATITEQDFIQCFTQLQFHWQKCVAAEGQYFEGFHVLD